jgi:transposase-like protein
LSIEFADWENGDNWYWFMERLKNILIQDVQDVCVIHNRHKGILQAMNNMKEGSQKRYRVLLWPDVKSRWCVRHMKANFHSQFKNKTLSKLFERGYVSRLSRRSLKPFGRNQMT